MRRLNATLLAALALAACKKQEPVPSPSAPAAMPSAHGGQAGVTEVKGKVLERLDAPPYSYLRIQTATGEAWAAVNKTDLGPGAEVTVQNLLPMQNFESPLLKRKFELVYFGSLGGGQPPAPHGTAGAMPPAAEGMPSGGPAGMPPGAGSPPGGMPDMAAQHAAASRNVADVGDVRVDKATGADARTIAEVYGQRAQLKEKGVTVRGKVVKFNEGIMGRNWVHLRDGTGTDKTNDLTVTTDAKVAVGDVVVVKGTVRVDRDVGTGNTYPVIVEDARVVK